MLVYVGETEQQLNDTMMKHLHDIKSQRDKPSNCHFSKKDHSEEDAVFSTTNRIRLQDREIDVRINLDTEITDSPASGM